MKLNDYPEFLRVYSLDQCSSTNDFLRRRYEEWKDFLPVLVKTHQQTAGRGRENRQWVSLPNIGLYCTFGFHFPREKPIQLLSLTVGVAVIEMLRQVSGHQFHLKWPNDITYSDRKIGGILIENLFFKDIIASFAGIGLNIAHERADFPETIRDRAISLQMVTGRIYQLEELYRELAHSFFRWLSLLMKGKTSEIIGLANEWSQNDLGRTIRFHVQQKEIQGILRGIQNDGGLTLELEDGRQVVYYDGEIIR